MPTIDELKAIFDKGNASDLVESISGLLELAGLDSTYASKFAYENLRFLPQEMNTYGFDLQNPFIVFLQKVQNSKPKILDYLNNQDNWMIVHNAIANNVLTPEQLMFNCNEDEQPKLLINPFFYTDISSNDKMWVLQCFEWCNDEKEITKLIQHLGIKLLFSNITELLKSKETTISKEKLNNYASSVNYTGINNNYKIKLLFMFNPGTLSFIKNFNSEYSQIKLNLRNIINLLEKMNGEIDPNKHKDWLVSSKLLSPHNISSIAVQCSEQLQSSGRDAFTGKFQHKNAERESEEKEFNSKTSSRKRVNYTSKQANRILTQNGLNPDLFSKLPRMTIDENNRLQDAIISILDSLKGR